MFLGRFLQGETQTFFCGYCQTSFIHKSFEAIDLQLNTLPNVLSGGLTEGEGISSREDLFGPKVPWFGHISHEISSFILRLLKTKH